MKSFLKWGLIVFAGLAVLGALVGEDEKAGQTKQASASTSTADTPEPTRTPKPTDTPVTPSTDLTALVTPVWKWPLIGQPGVVSETVTLTAPWSEMSTERTIPSSTMLRCSSGSMTTFSASRI